MKIILSQVIDLLFFFFSGAAGLAGTLYYEFQVLNGISIEHRGYCSFCAYIGSGIQILAAVFSLIFLCVWKSDDEYEQENSTYALPNYPATAPPKQDEFAYQGYRNVGYTSENYKY